VNRLDCQIISLTRAPPTIPVLARWFVEEWASYYGPDGPGDAESDLRACRDDGVLPYSVVALDAERRVLGTASLKAESIGSDRFPGPWLAALLVSPRHRRHGVGSQLVAAIETAAWRFGHAELYVSTDRENLFARSRGWTRVGVTQSRRGRIVVLRLTRPAETL